MLTIQFKDTKETFSLPFTGLSHRAKDVEWIKASGFERQEIQEMFYIMGSYTIPIVRNDVNIWYGDIAKTIVANL